MAEGWMERLLAAVAAHGKAVRVAIMGVEGSSPRESGAAMLVHAGGVEGTIGGGALEHDALMRARDLLAESSPGEGEGEGEREGEREGEEGGESAVWRRVVADYALGPSLGQCCGGRVSLLFEIFTLREGDVLAGRLAAAPAPRLFARPSLSGVAPALLAAGADCPPSCPPDLAARVSAMLINDRMDHALYHFGDGLRAGWLVDPVTEWAAPLYLYGAGHVGRAVAHVTRGLPFRLVWIDTDEDRFPHPLPAHAQKIVTPSPAALAAEAPDDALHVVMTYSHALDFDICRTVLARGRFAYLGVIGSQTKRRRFLHRLEEAGPIDPVLLDRLACPIGAAATNGRPLGTHAKRPAAIAVALVADLLARLAERDVEASLDMTGQERTRRGTGSRD